MIRPAALALAAILVPPGAVRAAPEPAALPTFVSADGICERLVVAGRDLSRSCKGRFLNTIYRNGRVGFYFIAEDGAALTFTGMGSDQVKPNSDSAVQPIDGIIFGTGGRSERAKAVGACRFSNPYKPPGTVRCRADTERGAFEAAFTTDGKPPVVSNP
ncbi:hypothetical protein [Methylobacterium durans]|uniref:Uncharacterized protein n=1 Tax=Methylobacterium durans TaxID=2202825 RepID=A0A2U8W4R2_9HYPH|nr:hypothetical protein [Methylobacterium durans]AWN41103.1 hypothetical protein DK389_11925 [Methylobacterium durans]